MRFIARCREGEADARAFLVVARDHWPLHLCTLALALAGLMHGTSMLLCPSWYTAPAWRQPKDVMPMWVWGACFLALGVLLIAASLTCASCQAVAFLLACKAALATALALSFLLYAIGHNGQGAFGGMTLAVFVTLQIIVALWAGRLQ